MLIYNSYYNMNSRWNHSSKMIIISSWHFHYMIFFSPNYHEIIIHSRLMMWKSWHDFLMIMMNVIWEWKVAYRQGIAVYPRSVVVLSPNPDDRVSARCSNSLWRTAAPADPVAEPAAEPVSWWSCYCWRCWKSSAAEAKFGVVRTRCYRTDCAAISPHWSRLARPHRPLQFVHKIIVNIA